MSRYYEMLIGTPDGERVFCRSSGSDDPRAVKARIGLKRDNREEIQKLVERVFPESPEVSSRIVVFAAPERACGTTWICARTAEALESLADRPTCLIDANYHAPALHRELSSTGSAESYDLNPLNRSLKKMVQRLPGTNLWLLPSEALCAGTDALLDTGTLQKYVAELRAEYSYVLIDAAPINLYADATRLGRLADGLVLVLNAHSTRRDTARKAMDSLESAGVRVLGAILNNRTYPIPDVLYRKL